MKRHFLISGDYEDGSGRQDIGSGRQDIPLVCSQIANYLQHMPGTAAVKWAVKPVSREQSPAPPYDLEEAPVTASTDPCVLDIRCYKPNRHAPPCARWGGEELQPQAQREIAIQHPDGAIEIPQQFDVDGRRVVEVRIHPEKGRKQAKCGNCLERYDITDDPVENHHRAMRHKLECQSKNEVMYSRTQRDNLLEEFHAQPNIVAQRQAWAAEEMRKLDSPVPTPEKNPWWKFW